MSQYMHSPARALIPATLTLVLMAGSVQAQTPLLEVEKSDGTKLMQVNNDAGLVITGPFYTAGNLGTIPATGAGARLMWYQGLAALRAGYVNGTQWDNANIGTYSVALGDGTTASGWRSVALGENTTASGASATALGIRTTASGIGSTAMGVETTASGSHSTAMGFSTTASGMRSTAMGYSADTDGKIGTFAFGDSGPHSGTAVKPAATNQFVVRAQSVWLGQNNSVTATTGRFLETSTGAYLSTGGTWTNSSDVNRKHLFETVSGEEVLGKIAAMPIPSWSYKTEDASVRHIGPTAQDFHAAFGLGDSDKAIATVDIDGVNLLAVQALEKRTAELREKTAEVETLRAEIAALSAKQAETERRLERLEAMLKP